jgi:hypothetical protein
VSAFVRTYKIIVIDDDHRVYTSLLHADLPAFGTDQETIAKHVGQQAAEGVVLLERRRGHGDDARFDERALARIIGAIEDER